MKFFDHQTLHDLEFTTIQAWLSDFGIGPTAQQRLGNLQPFTDVTKIKLELQKLQAP